MQIALRIGYLDLVLLEFPPDVFKQFTCNVRQPVLWIVDPDSCLKVDR